MSAEPSEAAEVVLLVDDDRSFCAAVAGALRRRGFKVMVAHDRADALEEARAWAPSRAVVDLRIGDDNGLEVVADLVRAVPGIRIVVLTGFGSIATAVEAIKLGAVHYLTKPADIEDILAGFERTTGTPMPPPPAKPKPLEEVEWEHLQRVLTDCGGNVSEAARRLGMHRRSLQRKLARGRPTEPSS